MISNYLTKRRLKTLCKIPIIEDSFDVCEKETIDEYQKAIEFIIKYNTAYGYRNHSCYSNTDYELWEIRSQIACIKNKLGKKERSETHPFMVQLKNRIGYMKKYLLLKHKNIYTF